MQPDRIWEGGLGTTAVRIGVPAALFFGVIQYARTGSIAQIGGAVIFGLLFGPMMAFIMWRRWPRAADLAAPDRVAVARAVRKGEDIGEARLAGAVIDYAGVVRRSHERVDRQRWVLLMVTAIAVVSAVTSTGAGETRGAVVAWVLVAWLAIGLVWWVPRVSVRRIANAKQAELAARRRTVDL